MRNKFLFCMLLCVLFYTPCFGAIEYDTSGTDGGITQATNTVSLTIASNDNIYLFVGTIYSFVANPPSSVVWNTSESLSLLENFEFEGDYRLAIYGLAGPTPGSHDVVVTYASTPVHSSTHAIVVYNVDQDSPVTDSGTNSCDAATDCSVTLTSSAGDMVIDVCTVTVAADTISATTGTERTTEDSSGRAHGVTEISAGASHEAACEVDNPPTGREWGIAGVSLAEVSAGATRNRVIMIE